MSSPPEELWWSHVTSHPLSCSTGNWSVTINVTSWLHLLVLSQLIPDDKTTAPCNTSIPPLSEQILELLRHFYFLQSFFCWQADRTTHFLNCFQVVPDTRVIKFTMLYKFWAFTIKFVILLHWKESAEPEILSKRMDFLIVPLKQQTTLMLQWSYFLLVRIFNKCLEILPELGKKLLSQLLLEAQNRFLLYSNPNNDNETDLPFSKWI